jgi:hypothetical protein
MSDDSLKSAYELALERLKAQDEAEGVEKARPLSAEQKRAITELRERARAKLAEMEILHRKNLASAKTPEEAAQIEQAYRIDRRRVESSLESAIARARRGERPEAAF